MIFTSDENWAVVKMVLVFLLSVFIFFFSLFYMLAACYAWYNAKARGRVDNPNVIEQTEKPYEHEMIDDVSNTVDEDHIDYAKGRYEEGDELVENAKGKKANEVKDVTPPPKEVKEPENEMK